MIHNLYILDSYILKRVIVRNIFPATNSMFINEAISSVSKGKYPGI